MGSYEVIINNRGLCKTSDFGQSQSLSDFKTGAY